MLISVADAAQALGVTTRELRALLAKNTAKLQGGEVKPKSLAALQRERDRLGDDYGEYVRNVLADEEATKAAVKASALRSAAERESAHALRERLGLRAVRRNPEEVRLSDAAALLGLSAAQLRRRITNGTITAHKRKAQTQYGSTDIWVVPLAWLAAEAAAPSAAVLAAQTKHAAAQQRRADERAAKALAEAEVSGRVTVAGTFARRKLERAVLHLGPTNSGKTYQSVQRLIECGSGVYAGPLRMLAWETYQRVRSVLGDEAVGLVTGEERINETAPILCCTAESAPRSGNLLILDEAHWVGDVDRGTAWTDLLLGDFREMHVIAAPEAQDVIEEAVSDAQCMDVVMHERLSALTVVPAVRPADVPPRSVVVAFSARAVRAIARELREAGLQVGMLYGSLPPDVRREQVRRLQAGVLDVIVATDVIGHGVNLPVDHVWLAEGSKFDGVTRRALRAWEAGQIAGRAGRGANPGTVGTYLSKMPRLSRPEAAVKAGALVANGLSRSDLEVHTLPVAPTLDSLGADNPAHLNLALITWARLATEAHASHPVLRPRDIEPWLNKLHVLGETFGVDAQNIKSVWPLDAGEVWGLIQLPVDAQSELLPRIARAVADPERSIVGALGNLPRTLQGMDRHTKLVRDALTAVNKYGDGFGGLTRRAVMNIEREAITRTLELIDAENQKTSGHYGEGKCSCGRPCAPWFNQCDACHSRW